MINNNNNHMNSISSSSSSSSSSKTYIHKITPTKTGADIIIILYHVIAKYK